MRIQFKTAGLLHRYLPPGSARNEAELDLDEGATPLDVMRLLGFPEERRYLVILNGVSVPAAERDETRLAENDRLGIFPPLKGG
jgi:sulfur carrier protein ThiS